LRLLLDEMYPAAVAQQLRARGHDVVAVTERPELRALPDADLFSVALSERRAVATANVADFVVIVDALDQLGEVHFGLVLVDPEKYPRGHRRTIGLVTGLDRVLAQHARGRAKSRRHWL
jgi:hypothetical protein